MNYHIGGFGLQGLAGIPMVNIFFENNFKMGLIVNGISGFYASLADSLGKETAYRRTLDLIKTFGETFRVMERSPGINKKNKIYHCVKWSNTTAVNTWEAIEAFVDGIEGETEVVSEVMDLEERKITRISGKAMDVALSSIAIPGLFPPFQDRYITTTFFSQIPVSFLEDGDVILLNLRNLKGCLPCNANDIIGQSMELKAMELAREQIKRKNLKVIPQPVQIRWKNFDSIDKSLKEIMASMLKEAEN